MTAAVEAARPYPSAYDAMGVPIKLHEAYQTLPNLFDAANLVAEKEIDLIKGPISGVYLKHKVEQQFGLCLLHRHFSMEPTERLVEHGPCSTPWDMKVTEDHAVDLGSGIGFVQPRSYRFVKDRAVPFEFGYTSEKPATDFTKEYAAFFDDLRALLKGHNLENLFGVRVLDSRDDDLNLEVTKGRNNVMVKGSSYPVDNVVPASWTFHAGTTPHSATTCIQVWCTAGKYHQHDTHP